MSSAHEVSELLRTAASSPSSPLDLSQLERRARRRRFRNGTLMLMMIGTLFSILLLTSAIPGTWRAPGATRDVNPAAPSGGPPGPDKGFVELPADQRAAVVGLGALTEVGLRDPLGSRSLDFAGATSEGTTVTLAFKVFDCSKLMSTNSCAQTGDTASLVVSTLDPFIVTGVSGPLTADEKESVIGYREPNQSPPSDKVFSALRIDEAEGARVVIGSSYWTGPIPGDYEATCSLKLFDATGKAVWVSTEGIQDSPQEEGARDEQFITEVPPDVNASRASMECTSWEEVIK